MNAPWQPIEREYPRVNTNVHHLVTTKFSTLVFAKNLLKKPIWEQFLCLMLNV